MTERSRPFRVGLVGAGRMGAAHARALARSDAVELAVVVEPSDAAAAAVGLRRLELEQLPGAVDGALVAAPTRFHLEIVSRLLDAGVPVLCEKPCGRTSAEARELGARAAGAFLGVGYWRRFAPELRALRARIAAGELGTISHLFSSQWDERPPSAAFRDPASSGGIVVDMGVHELDLIAWLTGQRIEDVRGFASSVCFDPPVPGDPESLDLVLRLSEGATALVTLGRRHPPGPVVTVEAIGTEDAVRVELVAPPEGEARIDEWLRAQAEAFAVAARGGPWEGATAADAAATLEAAERATAALDSPGRDRPGSVTA